MSAFEVEVEVGKTPTVDRVSGGVGPKEERRKGEKDNSGRKKSRPRKNSETCQAVLKYFRFTTYLIISSTM